jgi:hypothetical protein
MTRRKLLYFILVVFTFKKRSLVIEHYIALVFYFSMYLYPWRFLSWRNHRPILEPIHENERHRKLLPLIRRYTFISFRKEHSTKTNIDKNSSQVLQVQDFFIFIDIYT